MELREKLKTQGTELVIVNQPQEKWNVNKQEFQ